MGPGEGRVKSIPDAHTDFIFPIGTEEYGSATCILIVSIIFIIFLEVSIEQAKLKTYFHSWLVQGC